MGGHLCLVDFLIEIITVGSLSIVFNIGEWTNTGSKIVALVMLLFWISSCSKRSSNVCCMGLITKVVKIPLYALDNSFDLDIPSSSPSTVESYYPILNQAEEI